MAASINKNANFLDLNIKIKNFRFQRKLCYKPDNFDFNIFRVPYKSSNIPREMFYIAISAVMQSEYTKQPNMNIE